MDVNAIINRLGELSSDDTKRLAKACLAELTDDDQIEAVMFTLDESTLAELAAQIEG